MYSIIGYKVLTYYKNNYKIMNCNELEYNNVFSQLIEMFPSLSPELIKLIIKEHDNNLDLSIEALLKLSNETYGIEKSSSNNAKVISIFDNISEQKKIENNIVIEQEIKNKNKNKNTNFNINNFNNSNINDIHNKDMLNNNTNNKCNTNSKTYSVSYSNSNNIKQSKSNIKQIKSKII